MEKNIGVSVGVLPLSDTGKRVEKNQIQENTEDAVHKVSRKKLKEGHREWGGEQQLGYFYDAGGKGSKHQNIPTSMSESSEG